MNFTESISSRVLNFAVDKALRFAQKHNLGVHTIEDQTSPETRAAIESEIAAMPTYQQVYDALAPELQPEFESLGQKIEGIVADFGVYDPISRGRVVHDEGLTDGQRQVYDRYHEIYSIGRQSIGAAHNIS